MVEKLINQIKNNDYTKKIFFITIFMFVAEHLSAEVSIAANLFLGRAFSANIAREMLMAGPTNDQSDGNVNGFIVIDAAYQRAWNQSDTQGIGAYPFWSNFNSMTVGNNSGNFNVDAYQFGLGNITSTTSSITLDPIIYQTGSDFMFYIRSHQYGHSMFAKVKSALTAMVINPGLTETNPATPVPYPAGSIFLLTFPTLITDTIPDPSSSMTQAFAGITGGQQAIPNFRPMTNGLINGTQSTGAHLSDTEMTIGYNYVCQDTENMAAIGVRVTAPTGNKPKGVYILEPINGRGGNWGVGFYLAGTYCLWHDASENDTLKFNFMSSGIHLCTANVIRSYDLIANGSGSKYLLVADYNNNIFQSSIQNLVNLSTLESQSSFAFEGDAALALTFNSDNFSADLGYNVWGRTGEKLTISEQFDASRFAVLGRQDVSNYLTGNPSTLCQPTATISSSLPAAGGDNNVNSNGTTIVPATIAANRISGNAAFNAPMTAQYAAVTSKIFAKIGYNWKNVNCCPYLNIMTECEWSNISNNALPQWSLALIGGISL
jgi:hypothetical protein